MEHFDLPMHRSRHHTWLAAAIAAAVALCAAGPALAANIVKVRVGRHPTYTRVVFELDASAGYRVERAGSDAAPALRVSVDASSRGHEIQRAAGDVRNVKVEPGSAAVAHIRLRRPGLRLKETILSNPPRIVLDLFEPETAVAKARTGPGKPATVAKAPARKPAATPAPKTPAPRTAAPAPKPEPTKTAAATPAPKPEPTKTAAATPAPKPEPKTAAATPAPKPAVAPPAPPKPAAEQPAPALLQAEAKPEPKPGDAESRSVLGEAKATPPPAILPAPRTPLEPTPAPSPSATAPTPAPPPAIQPAPRVAPPAVRPAPPPAREAPAPSPTPDAGGSWRDRLTGFTVDPIALGAIAAALLALVAIVIAVRRRRRTLPNDLDVTAIAEEIEGVGRIPAGGFAMDDAPSAAAAPSASDETSFAGLFDEEEPAATRPAPMRPATRAPDPAAPAPSVPAAPPRPAAEAEPDSLFDSAGELADDEPSEGDAPMNQQIDLPADARKGPAAAPRMGGSAAPSPDMTRMFQELERRIQALEARLDEANEAREKLERQVAAQSEELRVQRAAIARTQRALRTMTRPDEDKATEPALREGDTQAKTRINI